MRTKEFGGVLPFWALLERLEGTSGERALANSVAAVALADALRTPVGRARGWVRQALNAKALEASVGAVLRAGSAAAAPAAAAAAPSLDLLELFWEPRALMRSAEAEITLLPLLGTLAAFEFAIDIEVQRHKTKRDRSKL